MGKYIDKYGFEVECAVSDTEVINNFQKEYDGSLSSSNGVCKEYVSRPFEYGDKEERAEAETSLKNLYEIITDINGSMGLHVHISLEKKGYYYLLASEKFTKLFNQRLKKSELWDKYKRLRDRVKENNNYAKKVEGHEDIDKMLKGHGSRYRRVNWLAMRSHNTIEFRIFPAMEKPEDVLKAVDLVTKTVNKFLQEKKYKEELDEKITKEEIQEKFKEKYEDAAKSGNKIVKKDEVQKEKKVKM